MRAVQTLPESYTEIYSVDLKKDKKIALLIYSISLIIISFMGVAMHFRVPIYTMFDINDTGNLCFKLFALLGLLVVYLVLHELMHGIAMKLCGTKKIEYGFSGICAFAGSNDYYSKKAFFFILLAPVVIWGIVIAIINSCVPLDWFWVVYIIQINNVSGAAGDLFIIARLSTFQKEILVRDYRLGVTVYSER